MQKNIFLVLYCIGCRTQLHYLKNASTIKEIRDRVIRYVHVSAKRRRWKSRTGCRMWEIVSAECVFVCAWYAPAPKITVCFIRANIPMHFHAKAFVNHLVRDNHSSVSLPKSTTLRLFFRNAHTRIDPSTWMLASFARVCAFILQPSRTSRVFWKAHAICIRHS